MQSCNLFDHIDLALDIQPPTRNLHPELLITLPFRDKLESQPLQQSVDQARIQPSAENAPNFAHVQENRSLIHTLGDHVDHIADQFSATRFQNHLRDKIAGKHGGFEICAALEAVRCI